MKGFLPQCFWNTQIYHIKLVQQGNHILHKLGFPIPQNCQFKSQGKQGFPANW